jgi:hypothetical protein
VKHFWKDFPLIDAQLFDAGKPKQELLSVAVWKIKPIVYQ